MSEEQTIGTHQGVQEEKLETAGDRQFAGTDSENLAIGEKETDVYKNIKLMMDALNQTLAESEFKLESFLRQARLIMRIATGYLGKDALPVEDETTSEQHDEVTFEQCQHLIYQLVGIVAVLDKQDSDRQTYEVVCKAIVSTTRSFLEKFSEAVLRPAAYKANRVPTDELAVDGNGRDVKVDEVQPAGVQKTEAEIREQKLRQRIERLIAKLEPNVKQLFELTYATDEGLIQKPLNQIVATIRNSVVDFMISSDLKSPQLDEMIAGDLSFPKREDESLQDFQRRMYTLYGFLQPTIGMFADILKQPKIDSGQVGGVAGSILWGLKSNCTLISLEKDEAS